jgi:hypothetical protein
MTVIAILKPQSLLYIHKKIMKNYFKLFLLLLVFSACKEKTIIVPEVLYGDMIGFVRLYDTSFVMLIEHGGVKVKLLETKDSTLTDNYGKWQFHNVPTGYYTISFSKDSFAEQSILKHQFIGNGTDYVGTIKLSALQYFDVDFVPAAFSDQVNINVIDSTFLDSLSQIQHVWLYDTIIIKNYYAQFPTTIKPFVYERKGIVLFSTSPEINLYEPSTYLASSDPYVYGISVYFGIPGYITINRYALAAYGFKPYQKVYCRVYAGNQYAYLSEFLDSKTGRYVYTGYNNASPVRSFIFPP